MLDGFNRVFGGEFSHQQGQLAVGCHLYGCPIYPLHVDRGARTTMAHSYNKSDVLHDISPARSNAYLPRINGGSVNDR
jgi:hypothetical protein